MPPVVASVSVIELPAHIAPAPEIAAGEGLTVTSIVTDELPRVYVMVAVPGDTGVTPVVMLAPVPTVTTETSLLLHVPNPELSIA